jgi:hypothetical protein
MKFSPFSVKFVWSHNYTAWDESFILFLCFIIVIFIFQTIEPTLINSNFQPMWLQSINEISINRHILKIATVILIATQNNKEKGASQADFNKAGCGLPN